MPQNVSYMKHFDVTLKSKYIKLHIPNSTKLVLPYFQPACTLNVTSSKTADGFEGTSSAVRHVCEGMCFISTGKKIKVS